MSQKDSFTMSYDGGDQRKQIMKKVAVAYKDC